MWDCSKGSTAAKAFGCSCSPARGGAGAAARAGAGVGEAAGAAAGTGLTVRVPREARPGWDWPPSERVSRPVPFSAARSYKYTRKGMLKCHQPNRMHGKYSRGLVKIAPAV